MEPDAQPEQPAAELGVIEVRHLRYFIAVAEEMHFGRAAERLHMAQSPLSHQIRQLEHRLGVLLLERDHHVIGVTDAGATFLDEARAVLAALDRAVERTRRAGLGEVGRISVGYVAEMTAEVLPQSLRAHRQRFPDVAIDLCQGTTGDLLQALRDTQVDVGFVRSPGSADDLSYEQLVREELYAARPERDGTDDSPIDLGDLRGETLVIPTMESARGLRQDIETAISSVRLAPQALREATSPTAMLLLVAAGVGSALVPASVARSFPIPGVEFRQVLQSPTTSGGMCWRRGESSGVVAAFLQTTREVVIGPPVVERGTTG